MKKFLISFLVLILSCKPASTNFIVYLNKVNEIDSIYRMKNDTLKAQKLYSKLFKNYTPHQVELIDEYETYIKLSDKYNKNFGGKKSLYRLIPLVAPNWKYKKQDAEFLNLYKKYGIDSLIITQKIGEWNKNLDQKLVDSFAVALVRDQEKHRSDDALNKKNDRKNGNLLKWTFENYGYPSLQKIGLWGNQGNFINIHPLIIHMAGEKNFEYFKTKILDYVKIGDCPPINYASMIDKYCLINNLETEYGTFDGVPIKDSSKIDANRRLIGMPSLKHLKKIRTDYFK